MKKGHVVCLGALWLLAVSVTNLARYVLEPALGWEVAYPLAIAIAAGLAWAGQTIVKRRR